MRVLDLSITASILRRSMLVPLVTYSSNRTYLSQLPLVDSNTLWCPTASDLDPFLTVNLGNCILLSYLIVYNYTYTGIKRSALLVISTTGESKPWYYPWRVLRDRLTNQVTLSLQKPVHFRNCLSIPFFTLIIIFLTVKFAVFASS